MKITFLGTAAAEGCPALFCNCQYCIEARRLGGKDIRTRSQSLINGDLLVDFPADTLMHFQQNDLRGDRIRYLLITHAHSDHFYPRDLLLRGSWYAHEMEEPTLTVLCPETVYARSREVLASADPGVAEGIELIEVKPFQTVALGRYSVTPLPARHAPGQVAVIYLVCDGEKTILYAHDTGFFYDEVFDHLEKNRIRLDFATFDCTNAHLPSKPTSSHMGFDSVGKVIERLRAMGAIDGNTRLFVNHFSHNGNPLHAGMLTSAAKLGCDVSFDGCTVEF